ncbi:O-methylsterigmatocystin oxidoreductase [Coprinopsis cinerea AmutBmut pab1-1]|nr:O-methylsterigmatocystin oxidoreductase [Coprinopsis cinerea AmutBmut pab1-1]
MRISYGVRGEYSERLIEKVDTFMRGWGEYAAPGRLLVSFFPSMKWIPSWVPGAGWKRRLEALAQLGLEVITQPFEDVKAKVAAGEQGVYHNIARSLVESLPDESDPTHAELKQIARNVSGISYVAGSDTTISSIYGLLLALAMKPEVQREAQAEIDAVTGGDRLPTCSDKVELPYVQAIVKEGGRWHTVLPLCLPHMSVDDDVYDGYFIPAGTWIIPNSWAVMHDPEIFEDPMEFKPERYLKDGVIDPSVLDAESGSFGYGRRICPGRYLGMETITLTIASLLAVFDVRPVKDEAGRPIPLEYITESGVLVSPLPFKCELVPRSPRHAELLRS